MSEFVLDPRLARDCFPLGRLAGCRLLLMNNAALPWFVLVPETSAAELHELEPAEQRALATAVARTSELLLGHFKVTKLNVATIGNVVAQLHVHVVGRHPGDYCWPNVVWGTTAPARYHPTRVNEIQALLRKHLALDA
jgi:diadenosine tetraphosphate (Ap4A) HIT family hydrolase